MSNIAHYIKTCGEITKSKGFDTTQHVKQLLLIASEVQEAMEEIEIEIEGTHGKLIDIIASFEYDMQSFEYNRKKHNLPENSKIVNHEHLMEELSDILIRVFSYAYQFDNGKPLIKALNKKIAVNKERPHLHGKQF